MSSTLRLRLAKAAENLTRKVQAAEQLELSEDGQIALAYTKEQLRVTLLAIQSNDPMQMIAVREDLDANFPDV